jgi:hypothetical protein
MRMVSYVNVIELIGTQFTQPTPSKHRSRRLWKKLRRKTAQPLYGEPKVMALPSRMLDAVRREAA